MEKSLKQTLWKQFGASIDMLEHAIMACPEEVWDTADQFWYKAYHCLFYLDYYLTLDPESFAPPEPFTFSEFDPSGAMPERVYSKTELLTYQQHDRNKCHQLIKAMTDGIAQQRWVNPYRNYSVLELLLYNMRHVQHHAAQLNLILRKEIKDAPRWVSQTVIDL